MTISYPERGKNGQEVQTATQLKTSAQSYSPPHATHTSRRQEGMLFSMSPGDAEGRQEHISALRTSWFRLLGFLNLWSETLHDRHEFYSQGPEIYRAKSSTVKTWFTRLTTENISTRTKTFHVLLCHDLILVKYSEGSWSKSCGQKEKNQARHFTIGNLGKGIAPLLLKFIFILLSVYRCFAYIHVCA